MNRVFSCIGAAAVFGAATAGNALADTLMVGAGETYTTIQAAIDAAAPGDTILVDAADGPYDPFVVPSGLDGLSIIGAEFDTDFDPTPGPDFKVDAREFVNNARPDCDAEPGNGGPGTEEASPLAVIDAADGPGSIVRSNDVLLQGFSFIDGNAVDGVDADETDDGGALDIFGSATVRYSCFQNNIADENGGAIFVADGASLLLTNSILEGNKAEFGGAVHVGVGASLHVVDTDFIDNLADGGSGGAIDSTFSTQIWVDSSCFIRNAAERSGNNDGEGGAIFTFLSPVAVENSTFCDNSAFRGGGAIQNVDAAVDLLFNTFWNNTSLSGGGIEAVGSPSSASDDDSLFSIRNTVLAGTAVVNNSAVPGSSITLAHSYTDQPGLFSVAGVIDLGGNLEAENVLPVGTTSSDLFVDADDCDFELTRFVADGIDNPLIDSGDSTAGSLINSYPPFFLLDPTDADFLTAYCGNLPFFDKWDNCRAVDVVDNPSTIGIDEGVPNTGIDIFNRNCTCDAVDIGAKEYQQPPFQPIQEFCEGDSDGSGFVDIDDLFATLNNFHKFCVEINSDL